MKRVTWYRTSRCILFRTLPLMIGLACWTQAQDFSSEALFDPALFLTRTNTAHSGVLNFRELEHVTVHGAFVAPNPAWLRGAAQFGGEWTAQGWQVPAAVRADVGVLVIDLDRTSLNQNLTLTLGVVPHAGAELYLDLLDTNDVPVVTNLFGNVLGVAATNVVLNIPLTDHPDAVVIGLRRGAGAVTITQMVLTPVDSNAVTQVSNSGAAVQSGSEATDSGKNSTPGENPATSDAASVSQEIQSSCSMSATNITWYVSAARGHNTYSGRLAWWNGQQHGPFATINRALGAATSNDTVVIIEGKYPENVDLRGKNVHVLVNGAVDLRSEN